MANPASKQEICPPILILNFLEMFMKATKIWRHSSLFFV